MSKKVDICVCVKNRQSIIEQTLNNILNQNFDDFRILCCDGKSNDMTMNKIFDLQEQTDGKVIAYETEKEGYVNSHNYILSQTDAEYICFIDSDDIVDVNKLEEQVKFLDTHPDVDVVSSTTILPNKKVLVNSMVDLNDNQITEYLKNGHSILELCHFESCMFRRKCLEKFINKIYFYPEYEDGLLGQGFLYTLHFLGYKFANIISTVYVYTRGLIKDSMSNKIIPQFANAIDTLSYEKKQEYITELFSAYNSSKKKKVVK